MDYRDIESLNMVNHGNRIKPNYEVLKKDVNFDLYISPSRELCIIGRFDGNYICWCSFTSLDDEEFNAEIFNHVARNKFKLISSESAVMSSAKYKELVRGYRCTITRALEKDMKWKAPFCYYSIENSELHGKFFSRDMISLYDELLDQCEFRIDKGNYKGILEDYYALLTSSNDDGYYCRMKPLITILGEESYLRICPNLEIRELYIKCIDQCNRLYCDYMTAVR